MDEPGHAAMARYDYATAGPWLTRFRVAAFAWQVPVDYREHYDETYALSLVKGCVGEVADLSLEL